MKPLHFAWLDRQEYQDFPLNFRYMTDSYYHVNATQTGLTLEERRFPEPVEKCFTDRLFSEWLDSPVALGAFRSEELAGVIEGSPESWHNVFRISNLLVMEDSRGTGVGSGLMERMVAYAATVPNCRGVILETQSCNTPAIRFYRRHGFLLSRIDIREYSNEDIQRREVRLDLFRPLTGADK